MSRESERGLQRKILDTARQLLVSVGYAQLSMRKIANSIGYSATSIYLYYDNKDELVHALIDEGVDLLYQELESANNTGRCPEERVRKMCHAYINFGLTRPQYYEIMYVLHPENIRRYPAQKYRKARRNLELIAAAISDGIEEGIFQDNDTMLCANIAWTQLHGVVTLLDSQRVDKSIDPELLIEATCDHIVGSLKLTSLAIQTEA